MVQCNLQQSVQSLFELNTDAILHVTLDGVIVNINAAFLAISGYEKEDVIGQNYAPFIQVRKKLHSMDDEIHHTVDFEDRRFYLVKKDGSLKDCLMRKSPIELEEELIGYFLMMKDMSELDKQIEDYVESEVNYRMIAENIQDVLILMDQNQQYLYVSPSSQEMFGFDHKKIGDQTAFFNIHPDYVEEIDQLYRNAFAHGEAFSVKLKAWHEERGWIWTEISGKAVYTHDGEFKHMQLVARDISRQEEQQQSLLHYAYHDNLTGLPNHRLFMEKLEAAVEALSNQQLPFTVMMMDIDFFKEINDCYGHEIGDAVIVAFGQRIQQVVGQDGFVARLGGDEFVVLLHVMEETDVTKIAASINGCIREPIVIQQTIVYMTASIGVSICTTPLTAKEALKQADDALYVVKGQGKNQFSLYRTKELAFHK